VKHTDALGLKNRARAERPLVLCLTRRRLDASDSAIALAAAAAAEAGVEAVAVDVDDALNAAAVRELSPYAVPEVLVLAKGVVLDRTPGLRHLDDARAFLLQALKRLP
jgi:hypothetical protein